MVLKSKNEGLGAGSGLYDKMPVDFVTARKPVVAVLVENGLSAGVLSGLPDCSRHFGVREPQA
jgi:hypothetical protein